MAEAIDIEVRFDGMEAAIQDLQRFQQSLGTTQRELQETGDSAKQTTGGFTGLGEGLSAAAFQFNQITGTLSTIGSALASVAGAAKDAALEFERITGVTRRFSGDIDEAAERTNGLISRMDLMIQSSRLAQAGLNLTATEMANLSVAAAETAAATGTDTVQALERLTDTLINAEEGGARRFGISLQGITDVAERQQVILRELENQYGDLESSVDSASGQLLTIGNRLDDLQTELVASIDKSEGLERAFANLVGGTDDLGEAMDRVFGRDEGQPLSQIDEFAIAFQGYMDGISRTIDAVGDNIGAIGSAFGAFQDLVRGNSTIEQFTSRLENAADRFRTVGDVVAENDAAIRRITLETVDANASADRDARLEGFANSFLGDAPFEGSGGSAGSGGRGGGGGGGRAREEEDILEIEERRRRVLEDQRATIAEIQEDLDRIAQAEADALRASEQALQSERERAKAASEVVAAKLAQQESDSALTLASSLEQQLDEALGSSGVQSRLEALGDLLDDVSRISVEVKGVPEAVERVNQLAEKLREAQEEARNIQATNIAEGVNEGFETAFDLIENAIQKTREYRAEIEAEIELRKAQGASAAELEKLQKKLDKARAEGIKAALNEFLKKTAREEVIKGLSELAQGIGLSIANPPEAATHYASAAAHFVVAGLAGAGAAATAPSSTSAGGGGAGGPAATPEPFDNNPSQNDQPQTVVVNYNSLVSGAEVGLHADETRREYERRFNTQRG